MVNTALRKPMLMPTVEEVIASLDTLNDIAKDRDRVIYINPSGVVLTPSELQIADDKPHPFVPEEE